MFRHSETSLASILTRYCIYGFTEITGVLHPLSHQSDPPAAEISAGQLPAGSPGSMQPLNLAAGTLDSRSSHPLAPNISDVGKGETGKGYKYDCLARNTGDVKPVSEIAMKANFEM
ncbi:hypothetical protein HGM15179_011880 [Zosterops borbonicus]|uniref:Uncharacterized protein n=1 Tax=Zosterops borbonicus TaxID=364589 RepID=A0A8K1GB90_9PASS|nr:hypothetical protein HGM15179_011880 [Zosterops borbonicus]